MLAFGLHLEIIAHDYQRKPAPGKIKAKNILFRNTVVNSEVLLTAHR